MNTTTHDPLDDIRLENGVEWIDGQYVEKPMGAKASQVNLRLSSRLLVFVEQHGLGNVFDPEGSYQLPKQKKIRKPDHSFVAKGRITGGLPGGHLKLAPDLAVEVISPNDLSEETAQRVADYFAAGVRLIWIVYPETRTAWVFRADGSGSWLTEQQQLSGEDVVPGFLCPLAPLFVGLEANGS